MRRKRAKGGAAKLVLVEWLDSHYVPGWHYDEPLTKPKVCRSVGWLVYKGPKAITVASHMTVEDEHRNGEMTIPIQTVVKITPLR